MNEYRSSTLSKYCPMQYICGIAREHLDLPLICRTAYEKCGEYDLLLTDMEYHQKMKRESERYWNKPGEN